MALPVVVAGGGVLLLSGGESKNNLTIEVALEKLARLPLQSIQPSGQWTLAQIFSHCAQSIEFSMSEFPQHKSDFFKSSIGAAAFAAFTSAGRMKHGLDEAIPGAPSLENENNLAKAVARLRQAFIDFDNYQQPVAPHFAYGELTKSEYEIAHVLHFNNHLEEVVMPSV